MIALRRIRRISICSMTDKLLTTQEVSDLTDIPPRTLQQWRYLGRGPDFVKCGHHVRYEAIAIAIWVRENTVEASK